MIVVPYIAFLKQSSLNTGINNQLGWNLFHKQQQVNNFQSDLIGPAMLWSSY